MAAPSTGDTLGRMADILPLLPAAEGPDWILPLILAIAVILLFALWAVARTRNPYRRLYRQLRRGDIAPRAAAHRLAHLQRDNQRLLDSLKPLRFRPQPPTQDELAPLLQRLLQRRGNGR